jgi:hypothetical protein
MFAEGVQLEAVLITAQFAVLSFVAYLMSFGVHELTSLR